MRLISSTKVMVYDNKDVIEYVFRGKNTDYKILNLGGIIKGIYRVDKNGKKENIVLAYDNIEDYYENKSYYGAIIGRTAGRIYNGKATIEGKKINFNKNYETSQCHGGYKGLSKKVWDSTVIEHGDECRLVLTYKSKDEDENYPGNLNIKIMYILNDESLSIAIQGVSDKDTLINLTNHSYFNLSGDYKESILDEKLKLTCNEYLPIDKDGCPTGEKRSVSRTPFDFREEKNIGKDINSNDEQILLGAGYDHCFIFDKKEKFGRIKLSHNKSGRVMEVETDNPAVVIYSMNYPDGIAVEGNKILGEKYGICFECQNPPIGRDESFKEYSLIKAGEKYIRYTEYKFSTMEEK